MAIQERQVVHSKNSGAGLLDHHSMIRGVLSDNTAQMAEVQKALLDLVSRCGTNIVECTMATQSEIARMSFDAILHGDPVALMSLGQRATRTGFRDGMECAARNLQAVQSLGSQILDTLVTPPRS